MHYFLSNTFFVRGANILCRFYATDRTMLKVALIQSNVTKDKSKNIQHASELIEKSKNQGAQLVALPECFNSPYGVQFFKEYAESVPDGETSRMLSEAAKKHSIYLVGGTIPELNQGKYYNTCTVWSPNGELVAKYRKIHLFDIDIPGKITFKESDILAPGNDLATFSISGIRIGLGICYDMRFEELAKLYRLMECKMLMYPGAFNMTTGPLHWDILQKGRAVDNQVFVCSVSPARGEKGYIAYGHSQVVSPWGKVLASAEAEEKIVVCDLDFSQCNDIRQQIPIFKQRRTDIYDTVTKEGLSKNAGVI